MLIVDSSLWSSAKWIRKTKSLKSKSHHYSKKSKKSKTKNCIYSKNTSKPTRTIKTPKRNYKNSETPCHKQTSSKSIYFIYQYSGVKNKIDRL